MKHGCALRCKWISGEINSKSDKRFRERKRKPQIFDHLIKPHHVDMLDLIISRDIYMEMIGPIENNVISSTIRYFFFQFARRVSYFAKRRLITCNNNVYLDSR